MNYSNTVQYFNRTFRQVIRIALYYQDLILVEDIMPE